MANYTKLPEDELRYACPSGCGNDYDNPQDAASCCAAYTEAYRCDGCGSCHSEQSDARDCCPNVSDVYQCCECGNTYAEETEARECCAPSPDNLIANQWKCAVDGYAYETEAEARGCCSPHGEGILVDEDGVPQLWCGECHQYNCPCSCDTCKGAREEFQKVNMEREAAQEMAELDTTPTPTPTPTKASDSWEAELA